MFLCNTQTRVTALTAALVIAVGICRASDAASSRDGQASKDRKAFFEATHNISLSISEADLERLRRKPRSWVPADVVVDGMRLKPVGVHVKGHGTMRGIDDAPSLTLKFNQFSSGQRLSGLRKVTLERKPLEKSFIRAAVAKEVFALADVPAPRIGYSGVHLNGRLLGAYVVAEAFTQDFLYDNFGTRSGTLWEGNCEDISESLELDYGDGTQSNLLAQVVAICRDVVPEKRFSALSGLVDLRAISSFLAAEVFCNSWDGYASHFTNYRVCYLPQTGRLSLIPNALDIAFNDPRGAALPQFNGMLAKAFVETPEGRELYLARLKSLCAGVYAANALRDAIEAHSARAKDSLSIYEPSAVASQQHHSRVIADRISNRVEILRLELGRLTESNNFTLFP